jgi:hypothetical protein
MNDYSLSGSSFKTICRIGAAVCMILIVYSIVTMILLLTLGPPPESVEECYYMLRENQLNGLLRLDILTIFILPLYYLLFFSIYIALKKEDHGLVSLSTIIVFAGVTLVLATPSVLSLLDLSDKFDGATSAFEKSQLLAAGESIMASDIWHGTGARIGGLLLQSGAVAISVLMLKTNIFNKLTAITGIVTHGLDLLHIIIGFFLPVIAGILMAIAGTLYLLWFSLVGIRLNKLSHLDSYSNFSHK